MGITQILKKWKNYSKMSNLGEIARRKFFNNCFDGALTCAGIVSATFIIFLGQPGQLVNSIVIITGFATALAIGISGLWGAFLSEEAERKKKISDMRKEMVILKADKIYIRDKGIIDSLELNEKQEFSIKKAMITNIELNQSKFNIDKSLDKRTQRKEKKRNKSVIQEAEDFATIIASLVDGGAPVLGSTIPLIPFFFGDITNIFHFIFSYGILVALLVYLGVFLGNISGGRRVKYALHLVTAGIVTLLVSLLLGQLT